jgi:nicotinate-nucleotide pyrophosphorylase (carboxylating)
MDHKIITSRLEQAKSLLPDELKHPAVLDLLQRALAEDLSPLADLSTFEGNFLVGDITSLATIPEEICLMGYIRAKASGVVAGLPLAQAVFTLVDPDVYANLLVMDGDMVQPGTMLAEVSGSGRALLAGERTALNLLGRLSGIASLTRQFVEAVAGTHTVILDTRKTAPGLRHLDKYAVRMGGGQNHRTGLFDMVLVKDNHITAAGGITPAVRGVREMYGDRYLIEVEVKDIEELKEAISLNVNRIMLDNMDLETMRIAVQIAGGHVPLEASGNVSLANVRQIAETGVDFISSGALTHSAPTLDISMKIG